MTIGAPGRGEAAGIVEQSEEDPFVLSRKCCTGDSASFWCWSDGTFRCCFCGHHGSCPNGPFTFVLSRHFSGAFYCSEAAALGFSMHTPFPRPGLWHSILFLSEPRRPRESARWARLGFARVWHREWKRGKMGFLRETPAKRDVRREVSSAEYVGYRMLDVDCGAF